MVRYIAGAETGFVIENADELAAAVFEATQKAAAAAKEGSSTSSVDSYQAAAAAADAADTADTAGPDAAPAAEDAPIFLTEPEINPLDWVRSQAYAFGFEAQAYSRNEESDAEGTVRGSYTTLAADGSPLEVRYKAGANIGFVIENLDEVVLKSVPVFTGESIAPAATASAPSYSAAPLPLAAGTAQSAGASLAKNTQQQDQHYEENSDASYTFGYSDDSKTRQEESDSEGNVRGQYSYINAEGNQIVVKYIAGPQIGFVIENEEELAQSVNKATADGAIVAAAAVKSQQAASASAASAAPAAPAAPSAPAYSFNAENVGAQANEQDQDYDENADASYAFGYSDDSKTRQEESDSKGNVRGTYSYVNAQGNEIVVKYSAGTKTGFVIENEAELAQSINKATADGASVAAAAVKATSTHTSSVSSASAAPAAPAAPAYSSNTKNTAAQSSQQDLDYEENSDASYSFGYSDVSGTRKEESDSQGNVRGSYSYINAEGNEIVVKYIAGPEIGFVVENEEELTNSVNKATAEGAVVAAAAVKTQQAASAGSSAHVASVATASAVAQEYSSNTKNTASQANQQDQDYEDNADASYSFGYSDVSGTRKEESDSEGNVRGSYSYINAEGNEIIVKYIAGPEIGFVVENEEELSTSVNKATADGAIVAAAAVKAHEAASASSSGPAAPAAPAAPAYSSNTKNTAAQSNQQDLDYEENSDASYSFGYSDVSGTRKEESDSQGNVRGSYSYINAEGNEIVVRYIAGPEIGFVVENEEELSTSVNKATAEGAVVAAAAVKAQQAASAGSSAHTASVATAPAAAHEYSSNTKNTASQANQQDQDYEDNADASYSFGYSEASGSRMEESDSQGNVRGSYSYINAEGNTIIVKYIAGPQIGFVIENEEQLTTSVRKATADGAVVASASVKAQQAAPAPIPAASVSASASQPAPAYSSDTAQASQQDQDYEENSDASYSFGYSDVSGTRKEESDSQGNVEGQYSYINAQGNTIVVKYMAGPGIGFVILNEQELSASLKKATSDAAAFAAAPVKAAAPAPAPVSAPAFVPVVHAAPAFVPVAQPAPAFVPVAPAAPAPSYSASVETNEENLDYEENSDASYSFGYSGDSGARQEESDAEGNVQGQYSYINAQGNTILVKYMAGPDIGFVILNEQELTASLEKANADAAVFAAASVKAAAPVPAPVVPVPGVVAPEPKRKIVKKIRKVVRKQQTNQGGYVYDQPEVPSGLYSLPGSA